MDVDDTLAAPGELPEPMAVAAAHCGSGRTRAWVSSVQVVAPGGWTREVRIGSCSQPKTRKVRPSRKKEMRTTTEERWR